MSEDCRQCPNGLHEVNVRHDKATRARFIAEGVIIVSRYRIADQPYLPIEGPYKMTVNHHD